MPSYERRANAYTTELFIGSSTPAAAAVGVAFGLQAIRLRIWNDGPNTIFLSLASTAATTGDYELAGRDDHTLSGFVIDRIGVTTNSTTTSTGLDGNRVHVTAWGE